MCHQGNARSNESPKDSDSKDCSAMSLASDSSVLEGGCGSALAAAGDATTRAGMFERLDGSVDVLTGCGTTYGGHRGR